MLALQPSRSHEEGLPQTEKEAVKLEPSREKESAPWGKTSNRKEQKKVEQEKKEKEQYYVNIAGRPKSILLKIGKQKIRGLVDTGAEVSLIHERVFKNFKGKQLLNKKHSILLHCAGGTPLNVLGSTEIQFEAGKQNFVHTFFVLKLHLR